MTGHEAPSTDEAVRWAQFLPRAGILALAEGLIVGVLFSGLMSGAGFIVQYWLLMAAIIGASSFVSTVLVYRIGGTFLSRSATVGVASIIGTVVGVITGYLLQPVGGPV